MLFFVEYDVSVPVLVEKGCFLKAKWVTRLNKCYLRELNCRIAIE